MHSCCTQLQQRTVMQPACVILLFYLSNRLLLPAVSLARWCLRALEDSFPDCGFWRGPSLRSGDNGRKREEREGQMGMTHKTEALMELQLLKLWSLVKRLGHVTLFVFESHKSMSGKQISQRDAEESQVFLRYIRLCVCVREPIPPPAPAVRAGRLVKLGAGRLSFFPPASGACWQLLAEAWGLPLPQSHPGRFSKDLVHVHSHELGRPELKEGLDKEAPMFTEPVHLC